MVALLKKEVRMSVDKEIEKYAPRFDMAAGYFDSLAIIKENFQNMAGNMVAIGFYLKNIRSKKLYHEGGYNSFAEFAKGEFGLSEAYASRYISINERFSIDGNSPFILEDKKAFSKSQLQEMLRLSDEQLEQVTPDMTVKEIRELATSQEIEIEDVEEEEQLPGQLDIEFYPEVLPEGYKTKEEIETVEAVEAESEEIPVEFAKEAVVIEGEYREIETSEEISEKNRIVRPQILSAYGLPKTEYEEGSLIATAGCGHKYDCFSCAQECNIRQENRYCVEAPLGNPFSCTTMNVIDCIREDIGEECQFINQELAFKRAGDNSPVPCCKRCDALCGYRCNRAGNVTKRQQDETEPQIVVAEPEEQGITVVEDQTDCESIEFVRAVLWKEKERLNMYLKATGVKQEAVERQKIIVAALASMVTELELISMKEKLEEMQVIQPELPIMTNNNQRGAFIDAYEEWPVWIDIPETGEKYYRYDFKNGSSFVVRVYFHKCFDYKSTAPKWEDRYHDGYGAEEYYILHEGKYFKDCLTNRSSMIEFLKNLQKK